MACESGTLIDIRQPGGRSLWCWKYLVAYTYDGFMIRSPSEVCNERMLDIIRYEAAGCFGEEWPVHILEPARQPGEIDYPPVRISAFFTSFPMRAEMHLSSLVVIWFQSQQQLIPDAVARTALETLNWDPLALDYEA